MVRATPAGNRVFRVHKVRRCIKCRPEEEKVENPSNNTVANEEQEVTRLNPTIMTTTMVVMPLGLDTLGIPKSGD